MKKLLSVLLVLSMLVTSCIFFVSCDKVSVKDVEKDPYAAINEAAQNTYNEFFTIETGAEKAVENALKLGALTLSFESNDLMGGDLTKISETIYVNAKEERGVLDTAVKYNGEELNALIFIDKNGLALSGEDLLGSDKTLAANIATIKEKLKGSKFAELIGINDSAADEIINVIESFENQLDASAEENRQKIMDLYNDILTSCDQTIAAETRTSEDGKKTEYVAVTYKITNDTLAPIFDKYLEWAEEYLTDTLSAEELNELKTIYTDAIDDIKESMDISLSLKLLIANKTNTVSEFSIEGTVTPKDISESPIPISALITFTENEIKLTADATVDGEDITIVMALNKEATDEKTAYNLKFDISVGSSVQINVLNASYTYENDGDIIIKADIFNDVSERIDIELVGKLTVTKDEATLEFSSLKLDSDTYNFKLIMSAKALTEIPAVSENAMDIMDLTEDDLIKIVEEFSAGAIGKLIFGY